MPRVVSMSVDSENTEKLLSALGDSEGILSVVVHPEASRKPMGDRIEIMVSNTHMFEVMRLLERDTPRPDSLTVSEPDAVYSSSDQAKVDSDIIETVWEETELTLQKTSIMDHNFLMLTAFAGIIAAVGLSTGVLHLVIAAMLIVPGFQPIVNIPLGIVLANTRVTMLGIKSTLVGYGVFVVFAVLGFHSLRISGDTSVPAFTAMPMVRYWTSFSPGTVLVMLIAAAAGVAIITTHRSVLTAGVMVALSLVPAAAIFGISLSSGLWEFAMRGLIQWLLNIGAVLLAGVIIFALKNRLIHKRASWH